MTQATQPRPATMPSQKTIKHEAANADAAAAILRKRDTQPYGLVLWDEACQRGLCAGGRGGVNRWSRRMGNRPPSFL